MKPIIHLLRYLVGIFFIFSGVVKGIDPIGTSIKMKEYFTVFTEYTPFMASFWELMADLSLPFSIFMIALEMILGIALLLGTFFNLTMFLLIAMIAFFTFLTGFTLWTGKVTDCGCFGDFMKLEPIETFSKDIFILIVLGIIWMFRDKMERLKGSSTNIFLGLLAICTIALMFTSGYGMLGKLVILAVMGGVGVLYALANNLGMRPNIAFVAFSLLSLISIGFTFRNVMDLPIVDFRAYNIDTNLLDCTSTEGRDEGERQIFYKIKDLDSGDIREIESQEYISSGVWKDSTQQRIKGEQREVVIREAELPPCKDFFVYNAEGEEIQSEILVEKGTIILISSYDTDKGSTEGFERVAAWAKVAKKQGADIFGLTGSSIDAKVKAKTGGVYDFNNLDAVPIKTMNRSNPGVTVVKDGVIVAKYHHNHLPDGFDF